MNKRILVTGGAGFLGSHLCERLLAAGNVVFCIDNLYTGSVDNIQHLLNNPHFHFRVHDICEPFTLEEPVEQIYNLACPASPIHYQADPIGTMKVNTIGVINVLEIARASNARVLQTSTCEVYGDPLVHPQVESYLGNVNPIGIRGCYDEGKRAAETLFFDYHRKYGVDIKVMRIFNTYGPRMLPNDGRVVSNFISQAVQGKPITVYGDGSQTRSFCYVDDLLDGMLLFMNSREGFTGPINMGNPGEYPVQVLAETVLKLVGGPSKIIHTPLPADDPKLRRPDITLAKQVLGWGPKVPMEDGIRMSIPYFKKLLT